MDLQGSRLPQDAPQDGVAPPAASPVPAVPSLQALPAAAREAAGQTAESLPLLEPVPPPLPDATILPDATPPDVTPPPIPPASAQAPAPAPPKPYPGLAQSLGLMLLLLLLQAILGAGLALTDPSGGRLLQNAGILGLINLTSFAVVCTYAGRRMRHPLTAMLSTPPPPGTLTPGNLLTLLCAVGGQLLCAVGFVYVIGGKGIEKSKYVERLNDVMGPEQSWWVIAGLLLVVAPFTEEILFRGQFLRGFLSRYAKPLAIGASAALFSLMHLNPVQIPATLMLGILSGILYDRTRSVWPSILAHFLNNAVPALAIVSGRGARTGAKPDLDPTIGGMIGLLVGGMLIWLAALAALRRNLPEYVAPADSLDDPLAPADPLAAEPLATDSLSQPAGPSASSHT